MTATKKTYVEWVEPFNYNPKFTQIVRMPVEQAIGFQILNNTPYWSYNTEEDALKTFMTTRNAYLKVYED